MRIAITGSSGLIGSALFVHLRAAGHRVVTVSRAPTADVRWDPAERSLDVGALDGVDAIVHLAGEPIAGRWTKKRKQRILESRVVGTELLAETVRAMTDPPSVVLSGSAIGFYGDTGETLVDETSQPGDDFLSGVAASWENAAEPIADVCRLVTLRTGIVLSDSGGALVPVVRASKLFVGGPMGRGFQFWSWISIVDQVRAIEHLLTADVSGPVNLTAPQPVTQREFMNVLGKVLRRPSVMPAPAFAIQAILGEMADALILTSARVEPRKLLDSGFEFAHPSLEGAFRVVLGLVDR